MNVKSIVIGITVVVVSIGLVFWGLGKKQQAAAKKTTYSQGKLTAKVKDQAGSSVKKTSTKKKRSSSTTKK